MGEKKTFRDAFKDGTFALNPPMAEEELTRVVEGLKEKPSEGLLRLWRKVGEGLFDDFAVSVEKPGKLVTLEKEDCDYAGFRRLIGRKAFYVGNVFEGTDSVTRVYELADGEDKGSVIALSYGDLQVYRSESSMDQLIETVLKVDADTDDICNDILNALASEKLPEEEEEEEEKAE